MRFLPFLAIAAMFGGLGFSFAAQKRRHRLEGLILGAALGPFGLLIEALLPSGDRRLPLRKRFIRLLGGVVDPDVYGALPDESDIPKLRVRQESRRAHARHLHRRMVLLGGFGILSALCGIGPIGWVLQRIHVRNYEMWTGLCYFGLGFPCLGFIYGRVGRWRLEAMKLDEPDARLLLHDDPRPPILYLRSFVHEGSYPRPIGCLSAILWFAPISRGNRRDTYEELLVRLLQRVGPVIAIGRPGEALPELGAARMYVSDSRWQDEVLRLMDRSRLVLLRAGESDGLQWEFQMTGQKVPLENIILYLEPRGVLNEKLRRAIPARFPQILPRAKFIHFVSAGTPRFASNLKKVLKQKGMYRFPPLRSMLPTMLPTFVGIAIGILIILLQISLDAYDGSEPPAP